MSPDALQRLLARHNGAHAASSRGRHHLAENAIRPVGLGRKIYLFIGSPEAGARSATLYSLPVSAKAQRVDPPASLGNLIERLVRARTSELAAPVPANWDAAYKAARLERSLATTARVA